MASAEQFQILRPLGADQDMFVARVSSALGPTDLVVVEQVVRDSLAAADHAELIRRVRALTELRHPRLVRVRGVVDQADRVLILSDYVDGEWLAELLACDPPPSLEVQLRVVLDVLDGLATLHELRDDRGFPLDFVHGAVSPGTIIVDERGVARIARLCRAGSVPAGERHLAPELRRGATPTSLTDVYSVGAILREALLDAPQEKKWAEPLTEIAWRACSVEPENRWISVQAMSAAIRRVSGTRPATREDVASYVRERFGQRLRARRAALELFDDEEPPTLPNPVHEEASMYVSTDCWVLPMNVALPVTRKASLHVWPTML